MGFFADAVGARGYEVTMDRLRKAARGARDRIRRLWPSPGPGANDRLFGRSAIAILAVLALCTFLFYVLVLFVRFGSIDGDDLDYPQRAMTRTEFLVCPGDPLPGSRAEDPERGGREDATISNGDGPEPMPTEPRPSPACADSQTVRVLVHILDVLLNENVWAPGDPMYKLGWFGIASFESGPFFDNLASFQLGALRAVRRTSVELVDLLGRARGTSAADEDLQDARGDLHFIERAWRINPFDSRLAFLATPASVTYRKAKSRLEAYNGRLESCDALFDTRSDNLFNVLDRIANDIGAMTDQLASRSKGQRWSVEKKRMVAGRGNNRGVFDFRADNYFYEAHGLMWAYHGILQGLRLDFGDTASQKNLDRIWDRMERHVAETADLEPTIVSNGREDSLFQPDHLAAMAVNMLRARANMTELREILNR